MVRKDLRAAPLISGNNTSAGACYNDNTFIRIRPDATAGRNIFGPKTNTRRDRTLTSTHRSRPPPPADPRAEAQQDNNQDADRKRGGTVQRRVVKRKRGGRSLPASLKNLTSPMYR